MQMKLSNLLTNIRDTLRAHDITEGAVTIEGEALRTLVETLDQAAAAARALEAERELLAEPCPEARPVAQGGNVTPLPRRRHHAPRARRHSPWRPQQRFRPGIIKGDDDGGDAA